MADFQSSQSSQSYRAPKGTYDVVPGAADRDPHLRPEMWAWVESIARDTFRRYNYTEVRMPLFEETRLFVRGVGESSDIVSKEMFTFTDRAGRELSLRPEGTAGVVRSYVEHSLDKLAQPLKLWYVGPMFRYERQQKGRYRQHVQLGAEALGSDDPLMDVEVMALLYDIHQAAGVLEEVIHVNNLGDLATRQSYVPELKAYLDKHRSDLDPDSVARLDTNPLRTFDSKDPGTQALLAEAPSIEDFLTKDASAHFAAVRQGLDALGIPYRVDDRLVRGFDYYTLTVFEAKSPVLGSQDAVGGGGRYNGLVEEIGGPDTPGIGFGSGVERVLMAAGGPSDVPGVDVYFAALSEDARMPALSLAGALRREGVACELDYAGRSAKGQLKQADRSGASWTVVMGEEELASGVAKLRDMSTGEEGKIFISGGHEDILRAVSG
ncbi:histidine--tRNA ligase [Rubrobacter aplysinae]|uniref:histidine--tRNA ligase n=1 Tax=Rubrobacter aplysinae TaxID=909625 RepID=UPI00064BE49B|nr:histidine--tRNA ligase [Rubrobacter aplysinae]